METKKVRLGSISLLFTVILLCIVVLSVLTVSTVRADSLMAQRMAQSVKEHYTLESEGQRWLAAIDEAIRKKGWDKTRADLPQGAVLQEDAITAEISGEQAVLHIRIERDGTGYRITEWKTEAIWEEGETWNLFQ